MRSRTRNQRTHLQTKIITVKSESVCDWSYRTRQRVYKRMLDEYKIEERKKLRQISPIQFLRDRELGMHGTNEPIFKQRATIECGMILRYESRDIYYWAEKIIKKIQYRSEFIASPAGIGRYIELILMNDFNYRWYYYADEPRNLAVEKFDDDYFDLYENYKGVSVRYNYLRTGYRNVLYSILGHCELCEQVACKCFVEKCDVI